MDRWKDGWTLFYRALLAKTGGPIIETKSIPGKIYRNSGVVRFTKINQTPPPYSMLHHIGREALPRLATRNCLKYLQTTLILGGGGWPQNLCEVL